MRILWSESPSFCPIDIWNGKTNRRRDGFYARPGHRGCQGICQFQPVQIRSRYQGKQRHNPMAEPADLSGSESQQKGKCLINGTTGVFTYWGEDALAVEVNRVPQVLPVIKVMDDRKEERWFLDQEDNPLMLQPPVPQFQPDACQHHNGQIQHSSLDQGQETRESSALIA